jgi:hypothetical protein
LKKIAGARTEIPRRAALSDENIRVLSLKSKESLCFIERICQLGSAARALGGAAMVACGFLGLPGMPIGYLIAGAGVVTVMTGFFGFCPMCAMAGRRLPSP